MENTTDLQYRKWFFIASAIAITLAFLTLFSDCEHNKALAEKDSMYEAISDSLKTWKDKDGKQHSEKQIVQSDDPDDFLKVKSNDAEVLALQKLVKQYKSQLGKQGSIGLIKGETVIDTFYTKPIVIYLDKFFYKDSIKNKWIDWKYKVRRDTITQKDSVDFNLKLNYEYAVIYKELSKGWFKKPVPYAEVVNYSPYSKTLSQTVYRVTNDVKPKRFGIGPIGGYGAFLNSEPQLGWFVGVGGSYNLIRF